MARQDVPAGLLASEVFMLASQHCYSCHVPAFGSDMHGALACLDALGALAVRLVFEKHVMLQAQGTRAQLTFDKQVMLQAQHQGSGYG